MARPALVAAPTHRREKPPAAPGSAPPTAERATLEDLFAVESPQPLADAFPGKRVVHPFIGMDPVPEGAVPRHWDEIHRSPRRNRGVAYIHVPFCENHCLFCGFYQNPWSASVGPPYVDAVIAQLESFARSPAHDGPPLQAVYLGGGTPTALASPDLARLVMAIRRCLPLVPDCEITLEAASSPSTATRHLPPSMPASTASLSESRAFRNAFAAPWDGARGPRASFPCSRASSAWIAGPSSST